MKRITSMFLSLAMVLTMCAVTPLTASAETYTTTIDGITYEIDTETSEAEVDDAESSITAANILSEVDGYSVTSVDYGAFIGCTSLTAVTIPDSVTSIGKYAFSNCTSLTTVTIPDSVTSIGNYAFEDCTSLTTVTIGDSVTSIGYEAFRGCTSLTTVTIPDSVTSIDEYAFYECTSLTEVTIGDSVTSIGSGAFYNTAYYNDETNWENDVLYIDNCLIKAKTSISGDYTIKDGTRLIAGNAFEDCTSLTAVTIGGSVTSIGGYAFGYYYDENWDTQKVDNFTIYGYTGSEAETYANNNGFIFIPLGQSQPTTTEPTTTTTQPTTTTTTTTTQPTTTQVPTTTNTQPTTTQTPKGDANGDGKVSVADARKLIVAIAKGDTQELLEFGDVNGDGKVSVADVRKIVIAIAKNDFNF